jgi:peroxiredoxin
MGRAGPWVVAAIVASAVVFALFTGGGVPDPVTRGSQAPVFALPALGGGSVSLGDQRGKVVLLNFWATWCKPCEAEMPAMQNLYSALDQEGFTLLAVSVDDEEAPVAAFRSRLGLSFPVLLDPGQKVSQLYQTYRFPESLLIDQKGRVVERYVGEKPWDSAAYVERVRRLVSEGS